MIVEGIVDMWILDDSDWWYVTELANIRYRGHTQHKVANYHNATGKSIYDNYRDSIAGEWGYARIAGLLPNMNHGIEGMSKPDYFQYGCSVDVKSAYQLGSPMNVRESSPKRDIYVQMIVDGRRTYYTGYARAAEVLVPCYFRPGKGYIDYYSLPQLALHKEKFQG